MYFTVIDIVVKSDGIFKGSNALYEISSGVTGRVKESSVTNGQYVKEGDVLYVLDIDTLSDTMFATKMNWKHQKKDLNSICL